ncbi:MAG: hypothetical protein SRB2_02372 [Desulfobacteraceae bacterium Eth-SRB2]|nr:MAG: hypothetical protein SRB2_02372 [Desulfobacteraceae bacterium Eth-SRB2]
MGSAKTDFRIVILASLCLIIVILISYQQVVSFDFVGYDDELYVTKNLNVQKGLASENLKWAFTTFHAANWHPFTWLSHMLDCELFGLNPTGHHWTNVQFHIANTLLLFFILFKMTGALWQSAFVAALFAVHPLHVESVAWISERKDVLSTFLGLLMMGAYYRYIKAPDFKNYLLIIIFLSIGLMCKPMLVTFPFVLLLLDFWPLKRFQYKNYYLIQSERTTYYGFKGIFRLILEKLPLFILVAISSGLTFLAQKSGGTLKALETLSLKTRISNAFVSYVSYLLKTIWPSNLAVFYPHPENTIPAWQIFGATLVIAAACFWAIRTSKKYPYILVGLCWYLVTLVPVIGFVQVGGQAMADRYTYIPLIGIFVIVAWGAVDFFQKWHYRKIYLYGCALIILLAFTAKTFFQVSYWKNGIVLFEHTVKVTENNYKAQNNLGTAWGPVDIKRSIYHYKEALRIKPDYAIAHYNLGNALAKQGQTDKTIEHYLEALRIQPNYVNAHNSLGMALLEKKNYDKAMLHFTKALKINPKGITARNNLANVLFIQGKSDEAISHYNEILKVNCEQADAQYNIAYVLSTQGNLDKAVLHYKEAIRINPEYEKAHYYLGNILIKQGELKEAFTHFAELIKINPDFVQAYNKIGLILFKQRKFKKAKVFFSKALQIDPNYTDARNNLEILKQFL